MSKGYPDFFGFSMFPYYGAYETFVNDHTVLKGETYDIIDLSLKGIMMGGYIRLRRFVFATPAPIVLEVDGTVIQTLTNDGSPKTFISNHLSLPLVTSVFSREDLEVYIILHHPISFDSSFYMTVTNPSGVVTIDIETQFEYTHIRT